MDIGSLFRSVVDLVDGDTRRNDSVDTDGLLGRIGGLFRNHGYSGPDYSTQQTGGYNGEPVLPASQDPLGDPADDSRSGVRPASEDPLGDPADAPRR